MSLSVYFIYKNTNNKNIKVLNIGDRLSQGTNSYGIKEYGFIDYYKEYLEQKNKNIVNASQYSKRDITITELLAKIKDTPELKKEIIEANEIFLTLGYNDLVYKINLEENLNRKKLENIVEETIKEYDELLNEIRKYHKRRIICIGYYKTNKKDNNLNIGIKKLNFYLETQEDIIYIDTYRKISNKEKYFSNPNSYYLNNLGYQKIFQEIIYQTKKA